MKEEYAEAFAKRLKKLRSQKNISRRTLSELCGFSSSLIAKYENGKKIPTMASLIELADFFGCSIDYLVGRE